MQRLLPVLLIAFLFSCNTKKENSKNVTTQKPTVAVVNYPLYYFAKAIGGENIKVYLPALSGDPSFWKPDARQVINFQNADLIFANGAGYAKWMEKVSLASSKIIVTSASFKGQWIETDEEIVHSHGPEGDHSHKGTASTIWLNFSFASKQAVSIHEALVKLLPEKAEELDKNLKLLKVKLMELDNRMQIIASKIDDQILIASHPLYQYLENGYGMKMTNLHWEPNEMPDEEMWLEFEKSLNGQPNYILVWEDIPLIEIRSKLEELNVLATVFNPCANRPQQGDFIDVMNVNIDQLELSISSLE